MNALRLVVAQLLRKPLQTALAVGLLALGIATLILSSWFKVSYHAN